VEDKRHRGGWNIYVKERHKSHDQNVFTGHQLQDQKEAPRNTAVDGIFKAMRGWGLELWVGVEVEKLNNSILVFILRRQ